MNAQLRVHGTMTVAQLKQLVKQRDGLPIHRCELHLVEASEAEGEVMEDEATLAQLGLTGDGSYRIDIVLVPLLDDGTQPPPSPNASGNEVVFDWNAVPAEQAFFISVGYSSKPVDESKQPHHHHLPPAPTPPAFLHYSCCCRLDPPPPPLHRALARLLTPPPPPPPPPPRNSGRSSDHRG